MRVGRCTQAERLPSRLILVGVALVVTARVLLRRRHSPTYDPREVVPWSDAALRGTVTRLAAEPEVQLAYLKHIMRGIDAWPSLRQSDSGPC